MGGLEEEADVKMILPCVGSKLREGSGLQTPEPSGTNLGRLSESSVQPDGAMEMSQRDLPGHNLGRHLGIQAATALFL